MQVQTFPSSVYIGAEYANNVFWHVETYVTLAAGAIVYGSITTKAAATLGAGAVVYGSIKTSAATTLGAGAIVHGSIDSGAGVNLGLGATVDGCIRSEAASSLGAAAVVTGSVVSVAAVNLGARALVRGDPGVTSGGDVTLGASAQVDNSVSAPVGAVTLGASAHVSKSVSASGICSLGDSARMGSLGPCGAEVLGAGAIIDDRP
jgi:predicted acyltransferase (DUF342 family)